MKKTRFTESQIIKSIKENESGRSVDEICRELGVTNSTFYNWCKKYSGMDLSYLKELQEENNKLKRMFADQALQVTILKDALGKRW